jgi:hypothetical protein
MDRYGEEGHTRNDTNIRKPETNDIAEVHINLIMNKISRNIVPIGRRNMAAAFIFDKYPLKSDRPRTENISRENITRYEQSCIIIGFQVDTFQPVDYLRPVVLNNVYYNH